MLTVRTVQVTFDCAEPERVGRFWCAALGYVLPAPPPGFDDWDAFDQSLATRVRLLPADDGEESCIVMQDVEGNEFCLD